MCIAPKTQAAAPLSIPEPPAPAPPPEKTAEAPVLDDKRSDQKRKNRTGTDVLRNDLSILSPAGNGLSIPG